ncbi:MAG: trypsin-like peptidase domain-containing protein [Defluviitaleaceae bacterium]|nr:trypsin-like peptidase domain-containing protein [Defluviitaleaceae bacterium]
MNDDSLDKQFDPWEIDKIQAEIDRDLNLIPEPAEPEFGQREISEDSIVTENLGDNRAALDNSCDFFKETVKNPSKMTFKRTALLVCVAAVLCGLSAGLAIFAAGTWHDSRFAPATALRSDMVFNPPNFSFVGDMEIGDTPLVQVDPLTGVMSFADLIESIKPSVVNLTSYKPAPVASNFFNIPGAPSFPGTDGSGLVPQGGTGIIFDRDDERLFIVTSNHVIDGAERVGVSIQGAGDVSAAFVGRDFDADLAVLSVLVRDVQALGINDFTIAAFADSQSMRVGDFVIAVGNALGRGTSATFGFVSVVDKELEYGNRTFTVIQTDAAINPGNSGGPLLNLRGEVIGINMMKFVEASVEGTGYALTSNVAMPIIEQIRNQQPRPILGVRGATITENVARAFSLPAMGVVVDSVIPDTGAYNAGIMQHDIITSFDGQPVLNFDILAEEVRSRSVGDTVEIILIRRVRDEMTTITLQVTLLEYSSANF